MALNNSDLFIVERSGTQYKTTASELSSFIGAYTHDQGIPSSTWNVIHNLDKSPSVTIVDSSGQTVDGKVTYINNNKVSIEFNAAFSGLAYLN